MAIGVLAIAVPAFAQMAQPTLRPSRPSRGLFGGGVGQTDQHLALNISIGAGHDWDRAAAPVTAPGAPPPPPPFFTGTYGTASADLAYSLTRDKITVGATAGGSTRYNQRRGGTAFGSLAASGHFSAQLTSRTSVSATHGISYQPHNIQLLFGSFIDPGTALTTPLMDLSGATVPDSIFLLQSGAAFDHSLTSRISFNAHYTHQIFNAFDGDPATGSTTQNAGAGLSFRIGRGIRLRAGYGHTTSKFGSQDPVSYGGPTLDGGLTLDRAISLSRRTTFGFGTGVQGVRDEGGRMHYFATGHANLAYEIGRSWTAAVNYRRGVDFSQGFRLPVVMDSASVGMGGDVGRRFHVNTGGGVAWGNLGVGPGAREYTVVSGTAGIRAAIARNLGVSLTYGYRQYRFDDPASLPLGVRPETQRHSLRASLDLWVPLFTRARSN